MTELILRNRSYRRFDGSRTLEQNELRDLVELARTSASAANKQPLKFILSYEKETNDLIFPLLSWAGYLEDWNGPVEEKRPTAYIIILGDTSISEDFFVDHGIAAQSMLLGAVEKGLGGCMIASFDRTTMIKEINIPGNLQPLLVIAIGKPDEKVVIDEVYEGNIRYFRDEDDVHHVPKRDLSDIIVDTWKNS